MRKVLVSREEWADLPYFPISLVYKRRFGGKVIKVPVALAETCPNREGLRGMQTCIFCDEWGSFAYPKSQNDELRTQIELHRSKVASRFNAKRFLIYFQAYTTTFTAVNKLREAFEIALSYPDVVGVVVGTRPDCLSDSLLRLWQEYNQKTYVGIELGVQSFADEQLEWMRRGHSAAQSIAAVEKVAAAGLDVGIHLMFGWPGENEKQMRETAELCNDLPLSNVKLHNLHVLKGTPLAEMYARGEFSPIEFHDYASRVAIFLRHLSPDVAIHRLAALSSRWDELIAPDWTRHKMRVFQGMLDHLRRSEVRQGDAYGKPAQTERNRLISSACAIPS